MLETGIPQWNSWLGKYKDERIRKVGPPNRCAKLSNGEEVCEWIDSGVTGGGTEGNYSVRSWSHKRLFVYDANGVAQAWEYNGSCGQHSSGRVVP